MSICSHFPNKFPPCPIYIIPKSDNYLFIFFIHQEIYVFSTLSRIILRITYEMIPKYKT